MRKNKLQIYAELVKSIETLRVKSLSDKEKQIYMDYLQFVYDPLFSNVYDQQFIDSMLEVVLINEIDNFIARDISEINALLKDDDEYYKLFIYTRGLIKTYKSLYNISNTIGNNEIDVAIEDTPAYDLIKTINVSLYNMSVSNRAIARKYVSDMYHTMRLVCSNELIDYIQYLDYSSKYVLKIRQRTYERLYKYLSSLNSDKKEINKQEFYNQVDNIIDAKFTVEFLSTEYSNLSKESIIKLGNDLYNIVIQIFKILYVTTHSKE